MIIGYRTVWLSGAVSCVVGILALAAGCGSSGRGPAITACTTGTGGTRQCIETASDQAVAGAATTAKNDCTQEGGVASDTCSHVGADGGCKVSTTLDGITVTTTVWYYAGAASTEMSGCVSGGDTWLSP